MKKTLITLLVTVSLGMTGCQDTFLQMPDTTGTVDLNEVYGSAKNAKSALMTCYREILLHGLPGGWGVSHGTLGAISGEVARGYSWHGTYMIVNSGLNVNGTDGSDAGADHFGNNWAYIRHCWTVYENIDRVPDMTPEEKNYVKAEALALIAYRYMGMFYRYGGLPIVRKSFTSPADPEVSMGRSSLSETLDYILELCQKAYDGLPEGDWSAADQGRMTRGAVLAIKARTLLFAARPLFNSATPYIESAHNDLVCFGSSDPERWNTAIGANEDVLEWALEYNYRLLNTGGAGVGQPNPNAFADYATATSTPANREVLLAYKCNETDQWTWPGSAIFYYNNYSNYWTNNRYDTDMSGLLSNFLELYYDEKGDDIDWPKVGDSARAMLRTGWKRSTALNPVPRPTISSSVSTPSTIRATRTGRPTVGAVRQAMPPRRASSPRCSARTRVARLRPSSTIMRARASGSSSRCSAWPKSTSIWPKPTTSMEIPPRHSKTSIWCTTVPVCRPSRKRTGMRCVRLSTANAPSSSIGRICVTTT